jgi:hypothetical protein
MLYLDVEVHRAFDVDQHRLTAAVEQDVVRAEFAVDERGSRTRPDRLGRTPVTPRDLRKLGQRPVERDPLARVKR